eukprot:218635-Chlamydomonas_euryale.AAC.2
MIRYIWAGCMLVKCLAGQVGRPGRSHQAGWELHASDLLCWAARQAWLEPSGRAGMVGLTKP